VGDEVFNVFVHVGPKIPKANFVKCVVQIVMCAACICVKGRENNISEAWRYNLELDVIPNNVDCLTDIEDAVDVDYVTVGR
jgi:hypothetical protein